MSAQRVRGEAAAAVGDGAAAGGGKSVAEMDAQLRVWEEDYKRLSSALSAARLDAAKRDAEIVRLESQLAHALARQPPHSAPVPSAANERLKAQLASAQAELASALTSANAMLRKLGVANLSSTGRTSPGRTYTPSHTLPDTSQLPAALSAAMSRLSDCLTSALRSSSAGGAGAKAGKMLPPATGRGGSPSAGPAPAPAPAGNSAWTQLQLETAERRAKELQAAVDNLLAERARLASQLHVAQAQIAAATHVAAPPVSPSMIRSVQAPTGSLVQLLQHSVLAVHDACKQLEQAAAPLRPEPALVKQAASHVVSELLTLESTIGLVAADMKKRELPGQPSTPMAAASAAAMVEQEAQSEGGGESQGSVFSFGKAGGGFRGAGAQAAAAATPGLNMPLHPGNGAAAAAAAPPHDIPPTPSSSSGTVSSSKPSLGDIIRPPPRPLMPSAMSAAPRAATVQPLDVSGWAEPAGGTANTLLAEKLMEARAKGEKWKARARQLGHQLALLGAGAAARDAATAERAVATERGQQEQVLRLRSEVARLQAALAGAEAARAELEKGGAARAAATQAAAVVPDTSGALGARLAELGARCATLERQLETERARTTAAAGEMSAEVARLKGALASEQVTRGGAP